MGLSVGKFGMNPTWFVVERTFEMDLEGGLICRTLLYQELMLGGQTLLSSATRNMLLYFALLSNMKG